MLENSGGTGRCYYFVVMRRSIGMGVVNVRKWIMHLNEKIFVFEGVCIVPTPVVFVGECKYSEIEPFHACI